MLKNVFADLYPVIQFTDWTKIIVEIQMVNRSRGAIQQILGLNGNTALYRFVVSKF